ncbi:dUTPase-like protein, partial [Dimargaris cristalligena]
DFPYAESVNLPQGHTVVINTGICMAIPFNYFLLLSLWSSMAKLGLILSGGVIDPDYRGHIKAIIHNPTPKDIHISFNDRVVQGLLIPRKNTNFTAVDSLDSTQRAQKGFGSS